MDEVTCKDCNGTGDATGADGQLHRCTNYGGSGSYTVEETFDEALDKARNATDPYDFLERRSSFDWRVGAGKVAFFEHESSQMILVQKDGPVIKMETEFDRLVEYLQSKVDQ